MITKQVREIENENCVSELQNDAAKLLCGKIATDQVLSLTCNVISSSIHPNLVRVRYLFYFYRG